MNSVDYSGVKALIVDDFDNFRMTIHNMLDEFGCRNIQMAINGNQALEACRKQRFDIILCDYNLGKGPTGQQVLEEIRYKNQLPRNSLFILVSAESSKDIVLSAYDYQPDAYLTKPINSRSLRQRLDRLLQQRREMRGVFELLDSNNVAGAIALAESAIAAGSRYAISYQKILGELYLQADQLDAAEAMYKRVLEVRPLDWAQVGMSVVKSRQGNIAMANRWLQRILENNPFCLEAYDVLAENYQQLGESFKKQKVLQDAVDVSPMSLVRQLALASAADANNDEEVASRAYGRTVRLGEFSCRDDVRNHLQYGRTTANWLDGDGQAGGLAGTTSDTVREGIRHLENLNQRFHLSDQESYQARLIESRLHKHAGDLKVGIEMFDKTERDMSGKRLLLEVQLDRVSACRTLQRLDAADNLLNSLVNEYSADESALKRLDRFLDEPASEENKQQVVALNNAGISAFEEDEYESACDFFSRALSICPGHVGVHLNMAQALIEKSKVKGSDALMKSKIQNLLDTSEQKLEPGDQRLERLRQLQSRARKL